MAIKCSESKPSGTDSKDCVELQFYTAEYMCGTTLDGKVLCASLHQCYRGRTVRRFGQLEFKSHGNRSFIFNLITNG